VTGANMQVHYQNTDASIDPAPGGIVAIDTFTGDINGAFDDVPIPLGVNIPVNQFCFVPTVSALDIQAPEGRDFYYNVAANNVTDPSNPKTPFLRIAAPNQDISEPNNPTPIYNEIHTVFSSSNDGLLQDALVRNQDRTLSGQTTFTGQYNFAEGTTPRLGFITYDGILSINANQNIGVLGSNSRLPELGSTFEVYTHGQLGCGFGSNIVMDNNSTLRIGDESTGNKGVLRVSRGTNLQIRDGANIIISEGSTLIIECGATLRLSAGASITKAATGTLVLDGEYIGNENLLPPFITDGSSPLNVSEVQVSKQPFCHNEITTVRIINPIPGTTVTWESPNDYIQFPNGNVGTSVQVVSTAGEGVARGGLLMAAINDGCKTEYVGGIIHAGPPLRPVYSNYVQQICHLNNNELSIIPVMPPSSVDRYEWVLERADNRQQVWSKVTTPSETSIALPSLGDIPYATYYCKVRAVNSCGASDWEVAEVKYLSIFTGICIEVLIYPNPISFLESLHIDFAPSETSVNQLEEEVQINIYDPYGALIHSFKTNHLKNEVQLQNLKKGLYQVQFVGSKGTHIQKVMVE
ncbi:MAG: T9SS type A sorting domain-containing protein, partial [Bacteroidota bacterium]